jgi:hypothetical protein
MIPGLKPPPPRWSHICLYALGWLGARSAGTLSVSGWSGARSAGTLSVSGWSGARSGGDARIPVLRQCPSDQRPLQLPSAIHMAGSHKASTTSAVHLRGCHHQHINGSDNNPRRLPSVVKLTDVVTWYSKIWIVLQLNKKVLLKKKKTNISYQKY